MEWMILRRYKDGVLSSCCRSVLLLSGLDYAKTAKPIFLKPGGRVGNGPRRNPLTYGVDQIQELFLLLVSIYPGLMSIGIQLHSAFTGSYVPGHHSVLLINSHDEQTAKDIGRYYWKGEIQEATEILMLVKTKSSKVRQVVDYVRTVHPYESPEILSFPVEDGSLAYMKWMDEAILD